MQQVLSDKTLEKARWLAQDGRVVKVGDGVWAVEASTIYVGSYTVTRNGHGYECECKSYAHRQDCCHVRAVAMLERESPWAEFKREGREEAEVDP
ncbi:MAG TPA: hypothetical protein VNL95_06410 [Dehalococcoidia bacterium]|nr:hypothetical protein [Dehalococcoidia bacterium]